MFKILGLSGMKSQIAPKQKPLKSKINIQKWRDHHRHFCILGYVTKGNGTLDAIDYEILFPPFMIVPKPFVTCLPSALKCLPYALVRSGQLQLQAHFHIVVDKQGAVVLVHRVDIAACQNCTFLNHRAIPGISTQIVHVF